MYQIKNYSFGRLVKRITEKTNIHKFYTHTQKQSLFSDPTGIFTFATINNNKDDELSSRILIKEIINFKTVKLQCSILYRSATKWAEKKVILRRT